jgi:hypothetical protein
MRVLFALTIASAFALPISAEAANNSGGGGSKGPASTTASKQTPSVRNGGDTSGVLSVKKSPGGGTGKVTKSPAPKPAAQGDEYLKIDGIKGESLDETHKN